MRIAAIIQARMGSTRFPGKVLTEICGHPLIWHIFNRVSRSKEVNHLVLATSNNAADDLLEAWAKASGIECFRGSEQNVLARYFGAAVQAKADVVVRVTADDPFKDPEVIDRVIRLLLSQKLDVAFNNQPVSFPEGLDCEVCTFAALQTAFENAFDPYEQEHVTQHFYRNPGSFRMANLANDKDLSYLRWTIDMPDDMLMANEVYQHLFPVKEVFLMQDILQLFTQHPHIPLINQNVARSAMYATK